MAYPEQYALVLEKKIVYLVYRLLFKLWLTPQINSELEVPGGMQHNMFNTLGFNVVLIFISSQEFKN